MDKPKTKVGTTDADGFDVVVKKSIGRVEFGSGSLHPHAAAFQLIGQQDEEGSFEFPMGDGRRCQVEVTHVVDITMGVQR